MRVRPGQRSSWAGVLAAATLMIMGLLTVAATLVARGFVDRHIQDGLAAEAGSFVAAVEEAVGDVELRLQSLSGLFRASEIVTAVEYEEYARIVGLEPGMGGLAYMPLVAHEDLAEFERATAAEIPGYRVFEMDQDGQRVPPQARLLHFPVKFFEPADSLNRPRGLDAGSPPGRLAHMMIAVETGQPTATPMFALATTGEQGFVMFFPVMDDSGGIEALVASPVILADLLAAVTRVEAGVLTWSVRDITGKVVPVVGGDDRVYSATAQIVNRTWRFDLSPAPGSPLLAGRFRHHWVLLIGLAFGLAAATAVYLWVRGAEAKRRVAALKEGLKAKDRFVATVSHELRTPLTGVVGIAEILREDMVELGEQERRELLTMLADEAADLSDIVEDLLVMARAGTENLEVELEPVDLAHEVSRVVGKHSIPISSAVSTPLALADPNRVRQIVRNLLSNAALHGGPDVRVTIGAEGEALYIDVADNGGGVAADQAEAIFDPYHSAHPQGGKPGSIGLGLSVARTLSRNMGGDLDYRRDGGETVFRLSLPPFVSSNPSREAADRPTVPAHSG